MAVQRDSRGRWRYRKTLSLPGGRKERISGTPILNTKMAAEIAEREHIQRLLSTPLTPSGQPKREVPTFETFAAEFMATYCENNNKPSEIASKKSVLKNHLGPFFGHSRLDAIQPRAIEMTMRYAHLSPDVRRDAVRLLEADPPDNRLTTEQGQQ